MPTAAVHFVLQLQQQLVICSKSQIRSGGELCMMSNKQHGILNQQNSYPLLSVLSKIPTELQQKLAIEPNWLSDGLP